MINQFPIFHP